jgi:ubiquinone biosynthesis protein COQ9
MSLLGNIPLALLELHALSNDILTLAGDSAVDATWYARRMALGAIYASAEVVMTRDPSPDLVETEAFVERRFADKEVLREKVEGVSSWVGFWGNTAVGVGRSWGLKI